MIIIWFETRYANMSAVVNVECFKAYEYEQLILQKDFYLSYVFEFKNSNLFRGCQILIPEDGLFFVL